MEFKVGDKVKIRKDSSKTKSYKIAPVLNMEKYKGKIAEITEFWKNGAMSDYKGFICYEMPED